MGGAVDFSYSLSIMQRIDEPAALFDTLAATQATALKCAFFILQLRPKVGLHESTRHANACAHFSCRTSKFDFQSCVQ